MKTEDKFDREKPYAIVSSNGVIEFFQGYEFLGSVKISIHGLNWSYSEQQSAKMKEAPPAGGNVLRAFAGTITVPSSGEKEMEFTEILANAKETGFELIYKMHFPEAVKLYNYQVSFTIRPRRLKDHKIIMIGDKTQEITIPEQLELAQLASYEVREVRVAPESPDGFTIQLDGPASLLVQDNRTYGSSDIELRFRLNEHDEEVAAGRTVERHFNLTYNQPLFLIHNEDEMSDRNDTANWTPFVLPWDDAPLDLSFLNEKPAGKHGFLKVDGSRFVFEDGTRAKFWGTCFSAGASFPTHEQSEKIARRLAKFGVNIVRTHHADAGWAVPNFFEIDGRHSKKNNTLSFDPESLDRFDYLIYCLKREGVYVYLDQLVHRKFKAGDGVDAADQLSNAAKPYSNFDPRLIELQKKFSQDLWTHVNPYTEIAYKDDPAIVLMEFANENDLFTQKVTLEPYRSRLEEKYRTWAESNGVKVGSEPVDFTKFTEPILRFMHEVQQGYYTEMRNYLRSIGVKVPMTGSNWSRNLAMLSSLMVNDYTDSHSYWDHPSDGKFKNRPMVESESNVLASLSFNRVLGKPFFVSEWNQPWPNEWRAEHTLAMAAVAAFQDWDGLTIYTYRHSTSVPIDSLSGAFESFNDPAMFGQFYHASLIFRRGDVEPAKKTLAITFDKEDVFAAQNPTPWGMPALVATAEKHGLAMAMDRTETTGDSVSLHPHNERVVEKGVSEVSSDTGQLYRSIGDRLGKIDTPRTKAVYGFAGEVESISMNGLELHVKTPFANIAISSLTDNAINRSPRLLLTAVGRSENTDFIYSITHNKMLNRGQGPILVEPIEATIDLETNISGLKVYAIGVDGGKMKQMPAKEADNHLIFDIGQAGQTIYYIIEKANSE